MQLRLGAHHSDATWTFLVWAPKADRVELVLYDAEGKSERLRIAMTAQENGYYVAHTDYATEGTLYKYAFAGNLYPDPASRSQPHGPHGPSECIRLPTQAHHNLGLTLEDLVIYELHVGTFTAEGTLVAAARELPRLAALGITMVELMPLAPFPGERNWGYDGVFPYAVHTRYGGPKGLCDFVRAAHAAGIGVMLDVVYNHLGPEGNYLAVFGPYFDDRTLTPWGPALNFDGAESDEVRRFFGASAEQWVSDYGVDGLRLDAVHEIHDRRAISFMSALTDIVHMRAAALGKSFIVIAESDTNDPRYVTPTANLGHGFDAMWCDDLHHALHVALTGESDGYYGDFQGLEHLARAWRLGVSYDGQYAPMRRRRHGRSLANIAPARIVVFSQNHDQIGNRAAGDRLTAIAGLRAQKLAAMVTLLSPYTPLLFMGEEYGELAPFQYFVDHGDSDLVEAVRSGRRAEFAHFGWQAEVPDPQAPSTFERSRINSSLIEAPEHAAVLRLYRDLLQLRRELRGVTTRDAHVIDGTRALRLARGDTMVCYTNFAREAVRLAVELPSGVRYQRRLTLAGDPQEVLAKGDTLELPPFGGVAYTKI